MAGQAVTSQSCYMLTFNGNVELIILIKTFHFGRRIRRARAALNYNPSEVLPIEADSGGSLSFGTPTPLMEKAYPEQEINNITILQHCHGQTNFSCVSAGTAVSA